MGGYYKNLGLPLIPGLAGPSSGKPTSKQDGLPLAYRDDLNFDPDGPGSGINAIRHFLRVDAARGIEAEAYEVAGQHYDDISSGKGNAFLHAYLSYRLTEELGPKRAKRFTDANEIRPPRFYTDRSKIFEPFDNLEEEMRADLYNQRIRTMALSTRKYL